MSWGVTVATGFPPMGDSPTLLPTAASCRREASESPSPR